MTIQEMPKTQFLLLFFQGVGMVSCLGAALIAGLVVYDWIQVSVKVRFAKKLDLFKEALR